MALDPVENFAIITVSTGYAAVRVVGFAVTADVLYFDPSPDYITVV